GAGYAAPLSGGEEVPPRATPAGGEATFQVSPDGQSLTYTVTVRDIANVTMGHIHLGPRGANGDIVLPLVPTAPPAGGPKSGVIGQGTATAAQLVGPLQGRPLAELIAQMDAGNAYVNIHTGGGATPATLQPGDLPPGEIRGQIALAASPASAATATPAAGATATRVGTATAPAAATATQAAAPTASAPPPAALPSTGGGHGATAPPWAAATALLTLALGLAFRRRLRMRHEHSGAGRAT
ncbi:MAG TPA: CHRD domain-containing protein, partial [Thermomicrobiales bacterium]